jgi:uncharacterized Zn-binding protein involved in type VI secretion
MLPVARVTDVHVCPFHGPNMIVNGSPMHTADGLPIARMGDPTACGATIVLASFTHTADGLGVAYLGSLTSHGGVITTGSPMHTTTP